MKLIILQLYWLSFSVIGGAFLLAAWRLKRVKLRQFFDFLDDCHPLLGWLITTGFGMGLFGVLLVPAFLLHLPMLFLSASYGLALAGSLVWLTINWQLLLRWLKYAWSQRGLYGAWWLVIAALALLADFALALKIGGPPNSDAFLHLAKINQLAIGGRFTFADPVLGNGIAESRYHINIILSLHAMVADLLHMSVVDVWRYSVAFWRLLVWVSFFGLTWEFINKKVRNSWPSIVMVVSLTLYSLMFYCADYPDRVVFAWQVLLLIGLKLLLEWRSPILLLLAAFLITLTHPLMAVICGGFLVATALALGLLRLVDWRKLSVLGLAVAGMAMAPLLTYRYPNRMSKIAFDEPVQLLVRHFGSFKYGLPVGFDNHVWKIWIPLLIASLIGYAYVIKQARSMSQKVMLLVLFLYFSLITLNPVVMGVAVGHVPQWAINRFHEMNIFSLIAATIGLLVIADWVGRRIKLRWALPIITLLVPLWFVNYGKAAIKSYYSHNLEFEQAYAKYYELEALAPDLQDQHVTTDLRFQQNLLPPVIKTNVFVVHPQLASPMANMDQRWECAGIKLNELRTHDLQTAGITRVLTNPATDPDFSARAAANPDLKKLSQVGSYTIYAVPPSVGPVDKTDFCYLPYGQ